MNKNTRIIFICFIVVSIAAIVQFIMPNKDSTPPNIISETSPPSVSPETHPQKISQPTPPTLSSKTLFQSDNKTIENTAQPKDKPIQNIEAHPELPTLTEQDLMGTSWKHEKIDMKFLNDGRWEMNGRICAKWKIEGSRVKLFNDDLNEIHYINIVGNTLSFNGEKISKVNN